MFWDIKKTLKVYDIVPSRQVKVVFSFMIDQIERGESEDLHYVNFKEFFHHLLNISQVLATIKAQDYFQCAFGCLANKACFSFNFAVLPDNKTGRHVCHLLATDKYSHSSGFVLSQEFHHYAISVG